MSFKFQVVHVHCPSIDLNTHTADSILTFSNHDLMIEVLKIQKCYQIKCIKKRILCLNSLAEIQGFPIKIWIGQAFTLRLKECIRFSIISTSNQAKILDHCSNNILKYSDSLIPRCYNFIQTATSFIQMPVTSARISIHVPPDVQLSYRTAFDL